jgi:hypothetical protein
MIIARNIKNQILIISIKKFKGVVGITYRRKASRSFTFLKIRNLFFEFKFRIINV